MFAVLGEAHSKGSTYEDEKFKTLIGMFRWLNYFPVSLGIASAEEAINIYYVHVNQHPFPSLGADNKVLTQIPL